MIASIELQVISKILTCDDAEVIDTLCNFDESYYSVFKPQIKYILDHRARYNTIPDVFTFQTEFPDVTLVTVNEPLDYLITHINKNKQHILLIETFNRLKDLGSGDVSEAWEYLTNQCERALSLDQTDPLDIIKDAESRAKQVKEFSRQARIPTGFPEIDKLMYGGFSTVEELVILLARTNSGKTWFCTKLMETAQKNGFPVLYYSPEMQAAFLGTRFDTWRSHFQNSQLYQGNYDEAYNNYIKELATQDTSAFILEDKDMPSGTVNTRGLENLVRRHKIKLVIVDGLSYMEDSKHGDTDYVRYKNMCLDLFKMSKRYGCVVVIAMQANRETRETKDDKGDPFPNLYNIEGSDHPARICTQAFALRQVFDKHVLDIRLEKSRTANNQKPVLSYAWDVNTGNMQYLPGGVDDFTPAMNTPHVDIPNAIDSNPTESNDIDLSDSNDVEF